MGRLVGLILMQMPSEDAFWLLVATLDQNLQDFYKENLIRLRIHATIFESLLYKYVPAVARHLVGVFLDLYTILIDPHRKKMIFPRWSI
jgi:hypothetical protein